MSKQTPDRDSEHGPGPQPADWPADQAWPPRGPWPHPDPTPDQEGRSNG